MADRTIPQRELRNNVAAVLRDAEAGETFTITVRGRPVARLVPPGDGAQRRVDVDRETLRRIQAMAAGDEDWLTELRDSVLPEDDPWPAE